MDVGVEALGLMSRREAAKALGVSIFTLDRLIKSGGIEPSRIGRRVLVDPEEVGRYRKSLRAAKPDAA